MRAVEIKNNQLSLCERPVPVPRTDEVLIRVKAAGINRPDLLQVTGHYPPPAGITDIPGLEVSGIIEQDAGPFKKGDAVMALLAGGGYADYVTAPIGQVMPKPQNWSFEEAAGLPEAFITVWANIHPYWGTGRHILVHGGSSGIGHIAIQMIKTMGGFVAVTVGSDEKADFCRGLGADLAINYKQDDFATQIEKNWGPNPLDAVLDMVGAPYFARNVSLLKKGGAHITIAMLEGAKAEIDLRLVLKNHLTITGSTLRPRSVEEKATLCQNALKTFSTALEQRLIVPHIDHVFALKDAQAAHEHMKKGHHKGKIIVTG